MALDFKAGLDNLATELEQEEKAKLSKQNNDNESNEIHDEI